MKLAEKIVFYRKRAGMNQEMLADKLGVSRQAVSKWETGEAVPELSKVVLLAKVFEITTDELLLEDGDGEETAAPEEKPAGNWVESMPSGAWVSICIISRPKTVACSSVPSSRASFSFLRS